MLELLLSWEALASATGVAAVATGVAAVAKGGSEGNRDGDFIS